MNNTSSAHLNSSPLSPAEQYAIAYQNPEPSNYTRMPNFIHDLTYDDIDPNTGKVEIKRLTVHAVILYMAIRQVAGNDGVTWKNTMQFAEMCNMSTGMVSNAKKELQKSFHQLDGNSLIQITNRQKPVYKDGVKISCAIYHQIIITDVWRYNRVHFVQKKFKKQAISQDERPKIGLSQDENTQQGCLSQDEHYIKQTCINTPLSKEQHSTAEAVSVVSSKKEEEIVDVGRKDKFEEWLRKIGFTLKDAKNFIEKYTIEEMKLAADYLKRQKEKGKNIGNILGYFRSTLENKYYLRKG